MISITTSSGSMTHRHAFGHEELEELDAVLPEADQRDAEKMKAASAKVTMMWLVTVKE